jgi:hypothetical protein
MDNENIDEKEIKVTKVKGQEFDKDYKKLLVKTNADVIEEKIPCGKGRVKVIRKTSYKGKDGKVKLIKSKLLRIENAGKKK